VAKKTATTPPDDWHASAEEIAAVVSGQHRDPHAVLGLHPVGGGAVVRVWRPEATEVTVLRDGAEPVVAERVHQGGFFEALLDTPAKAADYRLRVSYGDAGTFELRDAYAFWPTFGEIDLHLAGEGRHEELWRRMGAHVMDVEGVSGTSFAVWAPNARSVRVVGDFNSWDGRLHPMRLLGASGIWELFVPDVGNGTYYKYEVVTAQGAVVTRADPYAFATDVPPGTASRVHSSRYQWGDQEWLERRNASNPVKEPMAVYEMHIGSWMHHDADRDQGGRPYTYRELADRLPDYLIDMGFTHVEFLPAAEHPFGGSWGYQVTGYFAPSSRFGDPDDFRFLVDTLHQRGIGVIVDWVPAHFPKDEWALARFDGTALFEHVDPRKGEHPDWGTLVFNFSRNEVRNFLIANALFWLEELHIDGLRVDAVASMLYLDYSRKAGEWIPNEFGGRENLEAVEFLKEFNAVVYGRNPGAMTIAEESTAWPGVTRPTHLGGLGFGFKWNMGWMHDTLDYFAHDPIHRRYHHNELTFGLMYAWSENYVLPLSHDEVVHGKRSLLDKMAGDRWQKFANLRALYAWMWAHPGKQLLFMGGEFGQWREWSEVRELDWHNLGEPDHQGLLHLVRDLNAVYRRYPAMWQRDHEPTGFAWIDANNADDNVLSFVGMGDEGEPLVCIVNLAAVPRPGMRIGMPRAGTYDEVLNTDAHLYGGSGVGNMGSVTAESTSWHGMPASAEVTLPPLGALWLVPRAESGARAVEEIDNVVDVVEALEAGEADPAEDIAAEDPSAAA
jgi:1,4-alpha-glucan branching enzyme